MIARHINPGIFAGFLILIATTILQEGVVTHLDIGPVHPDLVLLVVLNLALIRGMEEGMLWGFIGGIFVDLFSGLPFGTSSTAYVVIAGLVTFGEGALLKAHILMPMLTAFAATIVYYVVSVFILASAQHQLPLSASFIEVVIGVAAFNALLNPALLWTTQGIERRLHPVARTIL